MNEDAIRAELNEIVDPCSLVAGAPAGIDELGLVRGLSLTEAPGGVAIEVRIGVTEPGCMMGASFAIRARERLEALAGVVAVDVQLDHTGDWDPSDIDPAYTERLATVRAARHSSLATKGGETDD
ncbi:MAG: metal-sulfur cluster assembly factor [Solirubrobacteraceae bacterium]